MITYPPHPALDGPLDPATYATEPTPWFDHTVRRYWTGRFAAAAAAVVDSRIAAGVVELLEDHRNTRRRDPKTGKFLPRRGRDA